MTNDSDTLNKFGMDISSILIDRHDTTGNTAYVTVEGARNSSEVVRTAYSTTDGGAHWTNLTANLPDAPASGMVVDPQNANTVYIATDEGVYFTTEVASCGVVPSNCWSVFGAGLPAAPVVALSASPGNASLPMLVAATYGRGIWQIPLSTAGTSLTSAVASSTALTFGSQALGTSSGAQSMTLQNTGTIPLTVTSISMSGDFSETDNCVNSSVAAGSGCAIQVTFTPGGTGTLTGQMIINANVNGGQLTVGMTGTGASAGVVSLSPGSLEFGQVEVGSASAPLQVQAGNGGGTSVPISSISITSPFKVSSNSCGTSALAANSSCQVLVEFAPTQVGASTGSLTFIDGAGTQTVALNGTAEAAPTDTVNPMSLSFAATTTRSLSASQTISLTNSGGEVLTGIGVSVSGAFQTSSNCGTQLAGQSACSISVAFAPTVAGSQSGTLTVSDALRTQTVPLTGTGITPPALGVAPSSLSFSTQQPGVASAPKTLTVSNTGGAAMANVGFQITGPAAASYSVGASTCGVTLTSGGSCTAQVVFTPAAAGAIAATLTVASSTFGVTPVSVPLNGSGQLTGGLGSSPAQLSFPTLAVGQSSSALPVTISNSSSDAIGPLALQVSGPFGLTQNTCTGNLAAGASCSAAVIFQPVAAGTAAGTLTVSTSGAASPVNVALSGIGFDFTVAVSGASSMTVAAGQTANYSVTITPANGVQGIFTYTCGTLPANALCLFNPVATTVSGGATGNVTVQISTGKWGSARMESPASWQMLPMVCGLLLLPLTLRRRRKVILRAFFLVFLMAAVSVGVSGCGGGSVKGASGGSGGSGAGSATPPGTYTIPVTFSSTGMSRGVAVTLTVD